MNVSSAFGKTGPIMKYQEIIDKMTLEEKASLTSGADFWSTPAFPQYGIPKMFMSDGPVGVRKQAAAADQLGLNASLPATCYPSPVAVANSWDVVLAEEMAAYLGKEARSQKVNVLLGPGTNIKRNPLCGRNFEYFSEDPFLAGKMAAAYVRGIQSQGISACLKHFAANNQETRRMVIDSIVDERTLREIYLSPFKRGIDEGGLKCLMTAYNRVNETYANENPHLMKDILRNEWKFPGVVVTDWGGSNDRVRGLLAGNNLEMPTTAGETNEEIVSAIRSGALDEKVLDESVDQLLTLVFETSRAIKPEGESFDVSEHHRFAQRVAEESIVLLKNVDQVLPLRNKERIAIIGDFAKNPRYQGAGSSIVNPTKIDNTLTCIGDYGWDYVGYEPGFKRFGRPDKNLIRRAVKLAHSAEVVLLYLGLDEFSEVEGIDRKDMKFPQNQIDLFEKLAELGKKIIIILSCGSSVEMGFADKADAILYASLSGQAGARAVLNVISGRVNPSGKLSESYPFRYEDTPTCNHFPGKEVTVEYREGLFVGYRYYDTHNVPVRYPFGFGLSYTTFQYSNLTWSENEVMFQIKNTGPWAGSEVAQLYISAIGSKVYRPKKELKGFAKIFLKPGETKSVTLPLEKDAFSFFNPETRKWETEDLEYAISVGASSQDIRLTGNLHVSGVVVNPLIRLDQLPSYATGDIQSVGQSEFETLLGRKAPKSTYEFYKKNRLIVGYNTTVDQLRYSRGWLGRLFSWGIRFANRFLHAIGQHKTANVLMMGVVHLPMRGLARMSGGMITWGQLDGLIMAFNGRFFKGIGKFFGAGKKRSKPKNQTDEVKL